MSDILGHDIDGRPLRVGDEVVVLVARQSYFARWVGRTVEIVSAGIKEGTMIVDVTSNRGFPVRVYSGEVRKLHNDHRPANESFTDMMNKLKSTDRVAD